MGVEELIDHLKSVETVEAWVYKDSNRIIAMVAGKVSWSVEELNEDIENNSKPVFILLTVLQVVFMLFVALELRLTFYNKRFR